MFLKLVFSLSTNCSCRVYGYSFYIGLLVPFAVIYIMNWVIFILIFASLLCRPNVRKETSNSENLHKLKENFMIALGLSLLFGMGWAIGLLATSDLPDAVRYPAEWVFTLTTAFLGVYLFILYVVRSPEARKLWKRWLLCQRKKATHGVSRSSVNSPRSRFETMTSAITSLWGTLKRGTPRKAGKNTDTLTHNTTAEKANLHSFSSPTGRLPDIASPCVEQSSVMENISAGATSPYLPPVEVELTLVRRLNPGAPSNNEEPVKVDLDTEFITETVSFYDNSSLLGFNALSAQQDPVPTGTEGDCYTVQNKETEGL